MGNPSLSKTEICKILRQLESGMGVADLSHIYGVEEDVLHQWMEQYGSQASGKPGMKMLEDENCILKQIVTDFLLERRALLKYRISSEALQDDGSYCGLTDCEQSAADVPPAEPGASRADETVPAEQGEVDAQGVPMEAANGQASEMHKTVRGILEQSRIIPALRSFEFIPAAIASPSLVVSLLYGNPMTIGYVLRKLRGAGKLPIANLDLLTGFAQDCDAVTLLVKLGVAGVVSTHQSVLRAAHSQGIIAMQRTFAVDSIASRNITRSLHHFVPHAIEVLPAVVAPLLVPSLRASNPELPVVATGLVNSMRQIEELVQHGVTSVATSNSSLWIL
ncbi:glycerol-3-phosphate responsive antiterminator [Telmatospirillum sp.]|uniref:glycerol-3-phosphate responsive antiterminator n=1 Tax=Telmatospirillum sp. TaxID=2079197 RepID=UPI00283C7911|nr:glycerol-3-phosphate responsive antiterminator [Telmatospirillum sp.]MDR3438268.1 glycerol-3-phosphate responsive antiterminator [Telmatospirillum sp.]